MQCRNCPTSPPISPRSKTRILGKRLERVRLQSVFVLRTADPPITAVEGRTVQELRRIGKRIAIGVEGEAPPRDKVPLLGDRGLLWLVIHLMIAGRLHWRPPQAKLSGRQSLLALDFSDGSLVLTEAGSKRRASLHLVEAKRPFARSIPAALRFFLRILKASEQRCTGEPHAETRAHRSAADQWRWQCLLRRDSSCGAALAHHAHSQTQK